MKKDIVVLLFNDKIYYYYKRKNITKIISNPKIVDGVSILDYKLFKKEIEKEITNCTNILEIIKPNLMFVFPYNYKENTILKNLFSNQLVGRVTVVYDKEFFGNYLLKNNAIIVNNQNSIDYIEKKNRQIAFYNISNKLNYMSAIYDKISSKEKVYVFNEYTKEIEHFLNDVNIKYLYFSNICDYALQKLKLYHI